MNNEETEKMKNTVDKLLFPGLFQQIEFRRLEGIAKYYGLPLETKEEQIYAMSVKAVYDGWLVNLYRMENLDDPDGLAYDLTSMTLKLFRKKRLGKTQLIEDKEVE